MKQTLLTILVVTGIGIGSFLWAYEIALEHAKESTEIIAQAVNNNIPEIVAQSNVISNTANNTFSNTISNTISNVTTKSGYNNLTRKYVSDGSFYIGDLKIIHQNSDPNVAKIIIHELSKKSKLSAMVKQYILYDWVTTRNYINYKLKLNEIYCCHETDLKMCYIHFELYNKSIHDDDFKLLSKEVLYHLFIVLSQMLVTPGHSELLYSVNFLDIINIICEKMFCNMKNDIDVISKISDVERIRDVVTCVKRHLIADGGFYFEFLKGNYIHLEIAVELGKKKNDY